MTVNRTATAAGKKYERDLLTFLREQGLDAERLRLAGVEDEGDLLLRLSSVRDGRVYGRRYVIEAKREKGFNLAGWLKEAELEAENYARHRDIETPGFVVVHARRNHSITKSYVTTSLEQWLGMIA